MRELKFRAYQVATKKMLPPEKVKNLRVAMDLHKKGRVMLMQFTGLKDCNGKEIYDGDTLIDKDVQLEKGVSLEETRQQVYWCEKSGSWKLDNTFIQNKINGYLLSNELKSFKYEVYGNIYEGGAK